MKLKASEIAFFAICLICAVVGISMSAAMRSSSSDGNIELSVPDSVETSYPVDVLNNATLEDLMEISGIGKVKAGDIIAFRDALGGFKRVEQLLEVSGISDATYAKIIEHFYSASETAPEPASEVTVTDEPVTAPVTSRTEPEKKPATTTAAKTTKAPETTEAPITTTEVVTEKIMRGIDINSASAEEIADALMIDITFAEDIVALREQIHYFSSVTELYLVDGMNDDTYRMIRDYIVIGN